MTSNTRPALIIEVAAKTFVQSLDFIIELVEGAQLTCTATTPVNFDVYPGETKQASFIVDGVGDISTVTLTTTGLPSVVTAGASASSTDNLPAVWDFNYTVSVNAPLGVSQTMLQWEQGALRCCKNSSWMLGYILCLAVCLTPIIHVFHSSSFDLQFRL